MRHNLSYYCFLLIATTDVESPDFHGMTVNDEKKYFSQFVSVWPDTWPTHPASEGFRELSHPPLMDWAQWKCVKELFFLIIRAKEINSTMMCEACLEEFERTSSQAIHSHHRSSKPLRALTSSVCCLVFRCRARAECAKFSFLMYVVGIPVRQDTMAILIFIVHCYFKHW